MSSAASSAGDGGRRNALRFVILLGVVSLLADVTYEGARSVTGPYLALLGASATAVGVVAGLGELLGYSLRLLFGRWTDRTGRYWAFTLTGYAVNLLAVPLLALAGRWEVAALLMLLERMGKAVRTPARDAMLSYATARTGRGWGFGLHEALDQVGAMTGPLLVAGIYAWSGAYRVGFAVLLIPALLALVVLLVSHRLYPKPRELEVSAPGLHPQGLPRLFWIYLAAAALIAAGYTDFPLIAFHFQRQGSVPTVWIPILYSLAMGVDAIAALALGRVFDRRGPAMLPLIALLSAGFAPLVFLGGFPGAVLGMVLWGIGLGAQESVVRATVANLVPGERRGSAYGVFSAGFGFAWFLGSATMGVLYDVNLTALILFSVVLQLLSIPLLRRVASDYRTVLPAPRP